MRRSVTPVRKTGLVEGPTKNHSSRVVPLPVFVARLLGTEIDGWPADALVFESARGGGYLTPAQARYAFTRATAAVEGARVCGYMTEAHMRQLGDLVGGEHQGRTKAARAQNGDVDAGPVRAPVPR